jgi:hypothetical protein
LVKSVALPTEKIKVLNPVLESDQEFAPVVVEELSTKDSFP